MIELPEMRTWSMLVVAEVEQQMLDYLAGLGLTSVQKENLRVEYNSVYDFWDFHLFMDDVVDDVPEEYKRATWKHIKSTLKNNSDFDHFSATSWRWNHHDDRQHLMEPTPGVRFWINATKNRVIEQQEKDLLIDQVMSRIKFDFSRNPKLLREFVAALVDQKII